MSHDSLRVLAEAHLAERLATLTAVWLEPAELPLGFGRDTIDLSNCDGSPRTRRSIGRFELGRLRRRRPRTIFPRPGALSTDLGADGAPRLPKFAPVDRDEKARAFSVQPRPSPRAGQRVARLVHQQ